MTIAHSLDVLLNPIPELAGKKQVKADVNMEELVGNTDGFADSGYAA